MKEQTPAAVQPQTPEYAAPRVEVCEVAVEKGFAESFGTGGDPSFTGDIVW